MAASSSVLPILSSALILFAINNVSLSADYNVKIVNQVSNTNINKVGFLAPPASSATKFVHTPPQQQRRHDNNNNWLKNYQKMEPAGVGFLGAAALAAPAPAMAQGASFGAKTKTPTVFYLCAGAYCRPTPCPSGEIQSGITYAVADHSGNVQEALDYCKSASQLIQSILDEVSLAGDDGQVNFRQFIHTAAIFRSIFRLVKKNEAALNSREKKLKFAFNMCDSDGDGFISKYELVQVLYQLVGEHINSDQLLQIAERTITEADVDHDGKISFTEFCKPLR